MEGAALGVAWRIVGLVIECVRCGCELAGVEGGVVDVVASML